MGTHPIFESDFDCLTDKKQKCQGFASKRLRSSCPETFRSRRKWQSKPLPNWIVSVWEATALVETLHVPLPHLRVLLPRHQSSLKRPTLRLSSWSMGPTPLIAP